MPTPLFPLVPTWNTFGPSNITRLLSCLILLTEEGWLNLTLVLGWYPMLLLLAIHTQPIPQLESTLVLTRYITDFPQLSGKLMIS